MMVVVAPPTDPILFTEPIVDQQGRPTAYFMRQWLSQRGVNDTSEAIIEELNALVVQVLANIAAISAIQNIDLIAGVGLEGGGDLSGPDRTFDLADTGVTAGSFTNTDITVDEQGRITAAANGGSSGGSVPSGGTVNQALTKIDGVDFNTDWSTIDNAFVGSEPADNTILKDADIGANVQAFSAVLENTTASFLTADENKLDGIEATADVTDAVNVDAAGAVMESDISGTPSGRIIDDDTMASASDTTLPTSESIKAYVDSSVASQVTYRGGFDPTGLGTPNLNTITSEIGDMYTVTVAGTYNFTTGPDPVLEVGDVLIAETDGVLSDGDDWTIVQKNLDAASIKVAYESNADTNAFTDANVTKLGNSLVGSDIGVSVQAFSTNLDLLAANGLTADELGELQNINTVTVTNAQWAFLGAFDQGLTTASNVSFGSGTFSGVVETANLTISDVPGGTDNQVLSIDRPDTSTTRIRTFRTSAAVDFQDLRMEAQTSLFFWTAGISRVKIASNGEVFLNLPTSAGTAGSLWNDAGTVKVA